jgi:hypothetical protein
LSLVQRLACLAFMCLFIACPGRGSDAISGKIQVQKDQELRPIAQARARIAEPVSVVDVPATLLAAAGVPIPSTWQSRPLQSRWTVPAATETPGLVASTALQEGAFRLTIAEGSLTVDCCEDATFGDHRISLYGADDLTDARDLLEAPSPFDLVRAARLAGHLVGQRARLRRGAVCEEEEIVAADDHHFEQLRALGYLGD